MGWICRCNQINAEIHFFLVDVYIPDVKKTYRTQHTASGTMPAQDKKEP
jgi:hypothetical protein